MSKDHEKKSTIRHRQWKGVSKYSCNSCGANVQLCLESKGEEEIGIKEMGGNRAPGQDIFRSKLHEGVLQLF